jgi:hypothetical protein
MMNARRLTLAVLGTLGASLMLANASALASGLRPLIAEFGSLKGPSGIAVDQSNGNVFANDGQPVEATGLERVDVFGAGGGAPAGGLPATLTGPSGPFETFAFGRRLVDVAVDNACTLENKSGAECESFDPSNGDIYVADGDHGVVDKFRVNGGKYEYICQFNGFTAGQAGSACYANALEEDPEPENRFSNPVGVAVDRQGDVYIAVVFGAIYEYTPAGEALQKIEPGLESPLYMAFDGSGDIYVNNDFQPHTLLELKRASFTGPVESTVTITGKALGFAFDQATGNLFVNEGPSVTEYDAEGHVKLRFGSFSEFFEQNPWGVAVDEATNVVYVTGVAGKNGREILAYGPPVALPSVVTGAASNVQLTTATVAGTVNPESATLSATCQVQYGISASYGSTAPCSPESFEPGFGTTPVTANLSGLEGNTTYHYRVTATNSDGTEYGADQTLTTPLAKPVVLSRSAVSSSPREATLTAMVGTDKSDTTYHFVYGTSEAYGLSLPAHDTDIGSEAQVTVSLSALELQPDTTYHYAVVATNAAGSIVTPDQTFTTVSAILPAVETLAAGEVAQNTATISGTVDSHGVQSTYEFDVGTDTSYGARVFGDAGSVPGPQTYALGLVGLAPGTTYHYRVVATDSYGVSYGADRTLTTAGFPTSLIFPPGAEPLVATPAFEPPASAGAIVPRGAVKATKPKAKKRRKKGRGRKDTRAVRGHGRRRGK